MVKISSDDAPAVIKKSTTPISRLVARRWPWRRTALAWKTDRDKSSTTGQLGDPDLESRPLGSPSSLALKEAL
jgi:hypothetical protein